MNSAQAPHPLETIFKGYRFRSHLEAQWAVYLDALGLQWLHRPETFQLPSGRHTPGFYVPAFTMWIEVTTKFPDLAQQKCASELMARTGDPVFFTCGMPDHLGLIVWQGEDCQCYTPDWNDHRALLTDVGVVLDEMPGGRFAHIHDASFKMLCFCEPARRELFEPGSVRHRALEKARGAHFGA